jgi:hypothetical protein
MRRVIAASLVFLVLVVGCRTRIPTGVVAGKVTYKGNAVNGAVLNFNPTGSGAGVPLSIPVAQDGTFRTTGVPPGDYKITVQGSPGTKGPNIKNMTAEQIAKMKESLEKLETPPTIKFPNKYTKPETTPLTKTIVVGEQTLELELTD